MTCAVDNDTSVSMLQIPQIYVHTLPSQYTLHIYSISNYSQSDVISGTAEECPQSKEDLGVENSAAACRQFTVQKMGHEWIARTAKNPKILLPSLIAHARRTGSLDGVTTPLCCLRWGFSRAFPSSGRVQEERGWAEPESPGPWIRTIDTV